MTQRDIDNHDAARGGRTWSTASNYVFDFGLAEPFPEDLTSRRCNGGASDPWILTRPRDEL